MHSIGRSILFMILLNLQIGASGEETISFRHEVLPLLSKHGCSAAECHGSPSGKGGFRLSLRGFDPKLDRASLMREGGGRRTNTLAPTKSLILLKPSLTVPHGGGLKLSPHDPAWRIIQEWIESGCPDDSQTAPECTTIKITNKQTTLSYPTEPHQITVTASFVDGTSRNITHLSTFMSSDSTIASVAMNGTVDSLSPGESTIVARYLDFIATLDLSFVAPNVGSAAKRDNIPSHDLPRSNYIDEFIFSKLKTFQIHPSPICNDSTFIRRVYLDVAGRLPDRMETETFLNNSSSSKRSHLVDHLLNSDDYVVLRTQKRADLLRVKLSTVGLAGVHKFQRWIRDSIRTNMPYDEFARAILTARGHSQRNPAALFYRSVDDAAETAETVSQLFLGVRIQCAKCHNHPSDRWSQDNYYDIASFFSRVRKKTVGTEDDLVIWLDSNSEITQPRTGRQSVPWLPFTGHADVGPTQDRRETLATWLASPDNPLFAEVAVNRLWGDVFGRGLVDPVDDFRPDNPPSHPSLLKELASRFIESGYDEKMILKHILNSTTYQLSSKTDVSNEQDKRYFSHAIPRLLRAEPLLDAICDVTGVPESFDRLPVGTRAVSLPSPDYGNSFLTLFGQPSRNTACECERSNTPKLAQALQLINGGLLDDKLSNPFGRLSQLFGDHQARIAAAGIPNEDGLVAWFRADQGVLTSAGTEARDGQSVHTWQNSSPHDGDSVRAMSPNERQAPKFAANAVGQFPGLAFDGVDDLLRNEKKLFMPYGSPRTIIVVGQLSDKTGGSLWTFGRETNGKSAVFTVQHIMIGAKYYVYSDGVNGAGNATANRSSINLLRQPFVTTFISPGANQKLTASINGIQLAIQQTSGVGTEAGAQGFSIGTREDISLGRQYWNGIISEILVYDRVLDPSEVARVGSYLATKYSLDSKYPVHPIVVPDGQSNDAIITDFYLAAFSRRPTELEFSFARDYIAQSKNPRDALHDIAWALLNSKEFLFQH